MGEKNLPKEVARSQPPSAFGGSSRTQPGCQPLGACSTPEAAARPALARLQGRSPLNRATPLRQHPRQPHTRQSSSVRLSRHQVHIRAPDFLSAGRALPVPSSTRAWEQTYKLLILDSGG